MVRDRKVARISLRSVEMQPEATLYAVKTMSHIILLTKYNFEFATMTQCHLS